MSYSRDHEATPEGDRLSGSFLVGLYSCLAFGLVKFCLYPALVLPDETAQALVTTLWGKKVTLQNGLVLAFNLGFALAKIPAISVISSPLYYKHRFMVLSGLTASSGLLVALPMALAPSLHWLQVLGMFLAAMPNSWIFGGLVSYLEGRRATEKLVAAISFTVVAGGAIAKQVASTVLSAGCPPLLMPLVLLSVALPPCVGFFFLLDRAPTPSQADQRERSVRQAMSGEDRSAFLCAHLTPVVLLLLAYTCVGTVRSYRDQFSRPIYEAALGHDPPSWFFLVADLPGAVISSGMLVLLNSVKDHYWGLVGLLVAMLAGSGLLVANSLAHTSGELLGGVAWQLIAGVGTYVAYQNTPVYERLIALSGCKGTCSFLVFGSDMCVYVGTVSIVLWKMFGTSGEGQTAQYFDALVIGAMGSGVICLLGAIYALAERQRCLGPESPALQAGLREGKFRPLLSGALLQGEGGMVEGVGAMADDASDSTGILDGADAIADSVDEGGTGNLNASVKAPTLPSSGFVL